MQDIYTQIVIGIIVALSTLQIITSKSELYSRYFFQGRRFGDWNLHYDEKINLTDARYLYLRYVLKQDDLDKYDFLPPPVSAAFGILPTVLFYLGFRIFGYNNFGLRFFFIILSCASNLFVVLNIMHASPGLTGFAICCIFLINWNQFVLTRHAIIENVLVLYLAAIYYVFSTNQAFFYDNAFIVSFCSASVILFKINFPLYVLIMLISIVIPVLDIQIIGSSIASFILGLGVFEIIQMYILSRFGVAKWRYFTLFEAFRIHGGRRHYVGFVFKPLKLKTFFVIANFIIEWFGAKKDFIDITHKSRFLKAILVFIPLLLILWFSYKAAGLTLPIFVTLFIITFIPFFFYLKRFIPLVPFLFIASSTATQGILEGYPNLSPFITSAFLLAAISFICYQTLHAYRMFKARTNNLEVFSKIIDDMLPERSHIYCHGIAYRSLWRIEKHRLFSADDDLMKNSHIIDWAVKSGARYVIITTGGRDFGVNHILLKIIRNFLSTSSDTEVPEGFILCEIDI